LKEYKFLLKKKIIESYEALNDFYFKSVEEDISPTNQIQIEIDNSTKTNKNSSVFPTNPFEIVEMIRRYNSMNDATNPSDAIDDALNSFNSLEEK